MALSKTFAAYAVALLAATASLAAPTPPGSAAATTPPPPAPKPVVVRQPPLPPANAATEAYQFRMRILGTPECLHFATEADAVFYDGGKGVDTQAAELKKVQARAKTEKCLAAE